MKVTSHQTQNEYVADILDQPDALRRSLAGCVCSRDLLRFAENFRRGEYKRVVLTGMGSSYFALYPLQLRLLEQRVNAFMVETSELIHYMPQLLEPETLLIVVSQSGRSAEIVRLLEESRSRVSILAVTNDEFSPLATQASATIMIQAGPESTVSCKTYVSSLQALEWLGSVLLGYDLPAKVDELREAAPAVERYLAGWEGHVDDLASRLSEIKQIFVTGRGQSLATTGTGGLILKESVRFPAEGMSCAAFRHGPFELLHRRVLVAILEGDARTSGINRRLAKDVRAAGGTAWLIEEGHEIAPLCIPSVSSSLRPIVEILPIQMISLALAARDGHDAGRFQLATKVTVVE